MLPVVKIPNLGVYISFDWHLLDLCNLMSSRWDGLTSLSNNKGGDRRHLDAITLGRRMYSYVLGNHDVSMEDVISWT